MINLPFMTIHVRSCGEIYEIKLAGDNKRGHVTANFKKSGGKLQKSKRREGTCYDPKNSRAKCKYPPLQRPLKKEVKQLEAF